MSSLHPLADRHDVSPAPEAAARLPLRVLLVEDNDDDVALILRLLRRGGYEPDWKQVQTAETLDQALALGHWDIVLSDYSMPQFDAMRALHHLRDQTANLPFIVISGSIGEETAVAVMRAGASDYLMKSNLTRLVPAIERELRESAERQERARTKKALLDLQEKFQVVFHEYLDVMLVLDLRNGHILHVNHTIDRVLGYDGARLVGQPFATLWDPDEIALAEGVLERVRTEGTAFYSGFFPCVDGARLPMDLQMSKVPWGRTEAMIATLRDVSERDRAERRLADEKEQLAVTLRSIGEGVITTDTAGRITLLNGMAERMTGWRQVEAAGRPLTDVLRLDCGPEEGLCAAQVQGILHTGQILELTKDITLHARDGRSCALALTGAPIRTHDGHISGVVAIFRDMTLEQKREEELQKASKLESVALMAGGIAHDFNNILTAILGHISLAKATAAPTSAVIGTIEKACMYATDLTRQLLTFAKGSTPNRQMESLAEVAREAVEFALHGSNMRCVFDLPAPLPPVEVDRNQIHQVINNLVINAVQATAQCGMLHVEARKVVVGREQPVATLAPGEYVRLSLRDNGSGIAPEHLARIFDPYFTTKSSGSGLGLATAYSIIKKHDGLIQAESELGIGTTFLLYLPTGARAVPALRASADSSGERARSKLATGGRVLFMDDEEILQELVAAMLGHLGYDVECAAHGAEALERYERALAEDRPFAVVIMDLTVPGGMGGHETMKRLRMIDPKVKAVVSSGYSNDPIMAEYARHGFDGVIAKPYQMVELGNVLEQVIRG